MAVLFLFFYDGLRGLFRGSQALGTLWVLVFVIVPYHLGLTGGRSTSFGDPLPSHVWIGFCSSRGNLSADRKKASLEMNN